MYKPNLTRQNPTLLKLTRLVRLMTGWVIFRKRFPKEFGSSSIYVTSDANVRYLMPGFRFAANDLLTIVERYIKPGQCAWDIGSNLGVFAFAAAFKAGQSGQVYSLEANPKFTELQNRSLPHLATGSAPITILCAALSDFMGLAEFNVVKQGEDKNYLTQANIKYPANEILSTKQVVTVTGDFLIQYWKRPDFVKIDIEGAEFLALKGSSLLLTQARPVIYIEVRPNNQDEVTCLLLEHDYRLYKLTENGNEQRVDHCHFDTIAKPAEKGV